MTAQKRSNTANLKPPINKRSPEEQKAICKRGGIASGKARRAKKQMREDLECLLGMKAKDSTVKAEMAKFGIKKGNQTNQMAIAVSLFQAALKGDVKAYLTIRDTLGESPDRLKPPEAEGRKVEIVDDLPDGQD